jgi:subtilisin family serine protease
MVWCMFGGRQGGCADPQQATSQQLVDPGQPADPGFVVGVIDTGVFLRDGKPHPFIASHLAEGWEANEEKVPDEGQALGRYDGHGTFVAGLIHAQAPTATIRMCNALDPPADIEDPDDHDKLVADLIGVLGGSEPRPRLINLSFLGADKKEEHGPPLIRSALEKLFNDTDVLVVAAAGNSGTSTPVWPACFNRDFHHRVIAVGALDETLYEDLLPMKASFSNWWTGIDACTPGVRVLGPSVTGDYWDPQGSSLSQRQTFTGWSLWSGTSFAAATVTGMLAQVMITQHVTGPAAWNALVAAHRTSFKPIPGLDSCPEVPYFSALPPVTRQEDAG